MQEKVALCLTLPSPWPCAPNMPRKIRELSPLEERTQICDMEHGQPGPPSSVPCPAPALPVPRPLRMGLARVERGGFSGSVPPIPGACCPQPGRAGLCEHVLSE